MAEPFGIVSGAIRIASAFTACVDCFEYVQFGRHFGRDFQTSQLTLNCLRLRLTQWGESVNIYDDPKLGRQDAAATDFELAKDALSTAKAGEDLLAYSIGDMDPKMVVLDTKMKGLATQRQKKGRFLKLTS
ncbi:hypothetical protein VE01_08371 [Pseudogymnoascus verrucosus]|uniref:Prion-inhibition and propagation HeLo domain-containing protein n=1 Tax=Pseudogymnoascus verrucosus TaxID=342668 RepID=A0A1B8GCN0_9PEZI|nr:uncharacterized protein VE01_08371 [Pseudogymnoascus verrucosus]OBT93596.1 hypothetical protein VE01_08371 [Pseudogymnoascus verrucosus]